LIRFRKGYPKRLRKNCWNSNIGALAPIVSVSHHWNVHFEAYYPPRFSKKLPKC